MTTHYPAGELESAGGGTAGSATSTPRSDYHPFHAGDTNTTSQHQRVRFMCSFGGKILPRPHDNQLRYVGGDTRIVAVNRHVTYSSLLAELSELLGTTSISIKYQLPNEDLDALISVTTDEDVENMMEEYARLVQNHKSARLRLFLFPDDAGSRAASINSLLDGSAKGEQWFLDALNGGSGSGLERGRSEASSVISEVPDYLFGLDHSDDPPRERKLKNNRNLLNENVSGSDPGSPAPAVSPPPNFNMIPDLPPVKTKPDHSVPVFAFKETPTEGVGEKGEPVAPKQTGYVGNPTWNHPSPTTQPMPVYYVPGPVQPGNTSVQPVPIQPQYAQPYSLVPGQVPIGFPQPVTSIGQVYGGGVRPAVAVDQMYYGVRGTAGMVPTYPGMMVPGGEEMQGPGTEGKTGRVSRAP